MTFQILYVFAHAYIFNTLVEYLRLENSCVKNMNLPLADCLREISRTEKQSTCNHLSPTVILWQIPMTSFDCLHCWVFYCSHLEVSVVNLKQRCVSLVKDFERLTHDLETLICQVETLQLCTLDLTA